METKIESTLFKLQSLNLNLTSQMDAITCDTI